MPKMTEKGKPVQRVFVKSPAKKKRKLNPNDVMSFSIHTVKIEEVEETDMFLDGKVDEAEPNDMLALRHAIVAELKKPGPRIRPCSTKVPFSKANFEKYFVSKLMAVKAEWNSKDNVQRIFQRDISIGDMASVLNPRWHVLDSNSGPEVTRIVNSVQLKYEEERDTLVTADFCTRCNFRGVGERPAECKHAFRIQNAGYWLQLSFTVITENRLDVLKALQYDAQ